MIRVALLLAVILLGFAKTFACVCGIESIQTIRQRSIETSELIFIGQIVLTDTVRGYFKLKVIKVFKGNVQAEVETSQSDDADGNISSCGFGPVDIGETNLLFMQIGLKRQTEFLLTTVQLREASQIPTYTLPIPKQIDRQKTTKTSKEGFETRDRNIR